MEFVYAAEGRKKYFKANVVGNYGCVYGDYVKEVEG